MLGRPSQPGRVVVLKSQLSQSALTLIVQSSVGGAVGGGVTGMGTGGIVGGRVGL